MPGTAPHAAEPANQNGAQPVDDDRLLQLVDELQAADARRGIRAWLLAPTIDLYHALMRGEDVPVDQLNTDAVVRYGLKR